MKTLDEIHDMIQTAHAGDVDRLFDICQALLDRLKSHEHSIDVLAEKSEREIIAGNWGRE